MAVDLSPSNRSRASAADRVVVAVGAGALVYLVLLGWRLDYLGHFVAGVGLALVALPLLAPATGSVRVAALLTTGGAVGASVASELWLFGGQFVDPVDIANLILGATLVSAASLHALPTDLDRRWIVAGVLCLAAGLALRFLVPFTLW